MKRAKIDDPIWEMVEVFSKMIGLDNHAFIASAIWQSAENMCIGVDEMCPEHHERFNRLSEKDKKRFRRIQKFMLESIIEVDAEEYERKCNEFFFSQN